MKGWGGIRKGTGGRSSSFLTLVLKMGGNARQLPSVNGSALVEEGGVVRDGQAEEGENVLPRECTSTQCQTGWGGGPSYLFIFVRFLSLDCPR